MVGFKNRYMLFEVSIDKAAPLDDLQSNLATAIKHSILLNFGECGLASSLASFQVKYLNPRTKLCIIRTSRQDYQNVWSAITMVSTILNLPASFNLLDLTGSIKACRKAAISCEEAKFEQLLKGVPLTDKLNQEMHKYLEKIKVLEH
ncbi:putative ribonuclease P/MRP protein subunit POP5 [Silene latifolia]|uniref:putative ribonuclease P/MRP protein subunit POP5 n=1 Tax=Silene latifolia TaxID=37657 RepID=UPI003D786C9B